MSTLKVNNLSSVDGSSDINLTTPLSGSFRTGQVIEELHSMCNKTSLHGRATIENVTAAQGLSNTYADATGSKIQNYTPPVGTKTLVYEYNPSMYWQGAHAITHWRLYFATDGDSGYTEVTKARHNQSGYYPEGTPLFRWVFELGASSADTTAGVFTEDRPNLYLKWQGRDYSISGNGRHLHGTIYWDGAAGNQFSLPSISIKAIA